MQSGNRKDTVHDKHYILVRRTIVPMEELLYSLNYRNNQIHKLMGGSFRCTIEFQILTSLHRRSCHTFCNDVSCITSTLIFITSFITVDLFEILTLISTRKVASNCLQSIPFERNKSANLKKIKCKSSFVNSTLY